MILYEKGAVYVVSEPPILGFYKHLTGLAPNSPEHLKAMWPLLRQIAADKSAGLFDQLHGKSLEEQFTILHNNPPSPEVTVLLLLYFHESFNKVAALQRAKIAASGGNARAANLRLAKEFALEEWVNKTFKLKHRTKKSYAEKRIKFILRKFKIEKLEEYTIHAKWLSPASIEAFKNK